MKFTIPVPEKISLNKIYAGVHWTTRKRWADDWHVTVLAARIATYSGPFPVHAHYHFKLPGKALDWINVAVMAKECEDGLVYAGVLPGDTRKYVVRGTLSTEQSDDNVVEVEFIHTL